MKDQKIKTETEMTTEQLNKRLGKIIDESSSLMLRRRGQFIFLDGLCFHCSAINKIQNALNRHKNIEWWIEPSNLIKGGVMYRIELL